jgi:hypothetical protein
MPRKIFPAPSRRGDISLDITFLGPPLPSIFLMDGQLTKTRGGKKGQIREMLRFCVFFPAVRVTTG